MHYHSATMADSIHPKVQFETHPDQYRHWKLTINGAVATLSMMVQEQEPLWPGAYELKLNSYDQGVDVELNDVVRRLRMEHPAVRAVVVTGGYDRIFCAGANIRMLAQASHGFKVNFCKFTNETRCAIEAASASGQVWIAALNGTASGGGYELAMACEEIYLIDDGNAAISLPEVPLLGVLPGTGGLTRLTDKRRVRRDIADVFCTKAEGFKARDAVRHRFADGSFPRSRWATGIAARAAAVAAAHPAAADCVPLMLPALAALVSDTRYEYRYVSVLIDPVGRSADIHLRGPDAAPTTTADTWAIRLFRELEDALLRLRFNAAEVGLLVLRSSGDPAAVLQHDAALDDGSWFASEARALQSMVLQRWDNMAKSLFAIIEPGNCFAGSLFELVLAADRSYMLEDEEGKNHVTLGLAARSVFRMASGQSRLAARYPGQPEVVERIVAGSGPLDTLTVAELELVTFTPDEIDWDDEVRIAIEERRSLSPDALTGMEQNLRFGGSETADTKIYGRLTAWQNWIFQRPNAVGERGALKMFGAPERSVFDFRRT